MQKEAFGQVFRVCKTFGEKLMGIGLFLDRADQQPVYIEDCDSIHTFGMRFPIDICFIDNNGIVMYSERCVMPQAMRKCRGAAGVFERKSDIMFWPEAGHSIQTRR